MAEVRTEERLCVGCEKTFIWSSSSPNKKYCSERCYQRKQKYIQRDKYVPTDWKPKELVCAYDKCDVEFTQKSQNQKFCKPECCKKNQEMIWGSQRKSKVTKVIKCKWCGEPFEKTAYEGNFKNFKYCSPKCSREYNSAKKKTGATDHSSKISLTRRGKSSSKQNLKVKLGLPDYLFGDSTYCSYCGESMIQSPSSIDHCIPRSFFLDVGVRGSNARGLTTHSCFKCNSILSDKIFDTFRQRREYVTNHYQRVIDRFFNEENTWTSQELDEHDVDYGLRKLIEQKIFNRYVLIDKVNWPYAPEYEEIVLAGVTFDIKYTDTFNEAQLPFMRKFFEIQ